jgi:hypothetical protein
MVSLNQLCFIIFTILNINESSLGYYTLNEELFIEPLTNGDINFHFEFNTRSEKSSNEQSQCKIVSLFVKSL